MESHFTIKKITRFNKKTLLGINKILLQWSKTGYQMTPEYFTSLITHSCVLVIYDKNDIIGTVTLVRIYKLSGLKGTIEHLIISEKYRGKGLGEKLMRHAIDLAKKLHIEKLFLTCDLDRVAANSLYQKLGFKIEKNNFYFLASEGNKI